MSAVELAVTEGRCAIAVSGALLRDERVVLALADRAALNPITLSGKPAGAVGAISDQGLARAIGQKNGLLVLVEPDESDLAGVMDIAERVKNAPHTPNILLISRKPDFRMTMLFGKAKVDILKERGATFITGLPVPPADAVLPEVKIEKPASASVESPLVFVGREDELATLTQMLANPGPIVLSGPAGVGRHTLASYAIEQSGLTRLPDLSLSRTTGFDTLIARLALILEGAGQSALREAIAAHTPPARLIDTALEGLQAAESLAGQVWVISGLEQIAGPSADFFRQSRVEMLARALLSHTYALRMVWISEVQPVFFREAADAGLRRLELGGIMGRFYHEIFAAFGAEDVSRDNFGPLSERLFGHPLAIRLAAVAIARDPSLLGQEKAIKLGALSDKKGLEKFFTRELKKLSPDEEHALSILANFEIPLHGSKIGEIGIKRQTRDLLVSKALLDTVSLPGKPRHFAVHPFLRELLGPRVTQNRNVQADVAKFYLALADKAEGLEALALKQEANRAFCLARQARSAVALDYPDADAVCYDVGGMLRIRPPNFDLAARVLQEVLTRDPANADAWLLELERLHRTEAKYADVKPVLARAIESAAVPELFHEAVAIHRGRKSDLDAIAALEQAVTLFPQQSRLRCRLAALLHRAGRRSEALEQLQLAMDTDPMLPDAYGLMGVIRREEGVKALDTAETLLREAVRLAPHDVVQTSRLVRLLLDIALGLPELAAAVRTEIRALLDDLVAVHKDDWEVYLLYTEALREEGEQTERARWFLQKAAKLAPSTRFADHKIAFETAMLDLHAGKLDEAEAALRRLEAKDQSNPKIPAAIAEVHLARGIPVAAHTELLRAISRTSIHALDLAKLEARRSEIEAMLRSETTAPTPTSEDTGEQAP